MTDEMIAQFVKERNAACLSCDVDTFRQFHKRWTDKGVYSMPLPDDSTIEIVMRKCIVAISGATDEQKEYAARWLTDRGFSTEL